MTTRILRSWHLMLAMMLLIPAVAMAGPGTQDPPGVRGTLYIAPTFPYSLTWDDDVWQVEHSETGDEGDRLELISQKSRFIAESFPDSGNRSIDCATNAVNELLAAAGTHEVIDEPTTGNGFSAATVRTMDGAQQGDVTYEITCLSPQSSLPFAVRMTHVTWTADRATTHAAAAEVIGSFRLAYSASTQAVTATPQAVPAGWLDVDLQRIEDPEWPLPLNPTFQFLTIQLIVENVDQIPSFFDLRNVRLLGIDVPAHGYAWMLDTGGTGEPLISIAPGETAIARLIFVIPSGSDLSTACYQVRATCLDLGTFGNGGSGIRPRINPG